jgi:hypothetical protein
MASAMGEGPSIYAALKGAGHPHAAASSVADVRPASAPPIAPTARGSDPSPRAEPSADRSEKKPAGPLAIVVALAFVVTLTLAAPFLEITDAPINAIIILIGLWEAWRRSRGLPIVIEGPFRVAVAPPATAPPAA